MQALVPVLLVWTTPLAAQIDAALAGQYFQEAKTACRADGGKLWGVSLCGPLLFVDPGSRAVVANQADAEGRLARQRDIFTGRLANEVNPANTAVTWAGVKWTMVVWPWIPKDPAARSRLLLHEMWHRIQSDLGLQAPERNNTHLDTVEGRYWLQLEWRALGKALETTGGDRRRAIADALGFRARRRSLFPNAAAEERAVEINEGLAEYTGVRLQESATGLAADALRRAVKNASFVRSFAYASGPAWGLLLDDTRAAWRKGLKPDSDLGELFGKAAGIASSADAEARAEAYDGAALHAAEAAREEQRRGREADYRARLIAGRVLLLPLSPTMRWSFDPNNLFPLGDAGTVYPTMRVSDNWGVIEVSGGALLSPDRRRLAVPAPRDSSALSGDGWELTLSPGWSVKRGGRAGDFTLEAP